MADNRLRSGGALSCFCCTGCITFIISILVYDTIFTLRLVAVLLLLLKKFLTIRYKSISVRVCWNYESREFGLVRVSK